MKRLILLMLVFFLCHYTYVMQVHFDAIKWPIPDALFTPEDQQLMESEVEQASELYRIGLQKKQDDQARLAFAQEFKLALCNELKLFLRSGPEDNFKDYNIGYHVVLGVFRQIDADIRRFQDTD